jgi:hypothetical protein
MMRNSEDCETANDEQRYRFGDGPVQTVARAMSPHDQPPILQQDN